jgi:hypothetical protein
MFTLEEIIMLEQRPLLQFLTSTSTNLAPPDGHAFFDKVQRFSDDDLWHFLQTGMAAHERAEQRNGAPSVRRYGSAGLYVIPGGRR